MDFFSQIGAQEILIILLVAIIIIGPKKIVEFGKNAGKLSRNLKKVTTDFSSSLTAEMDEEEKTKKLMAAKSNSKVSSYKN
jgi:TatA/E family protein of Tat protein translocase